mgnify:CR=1 FL=1
MDQGRGPHTKTVAEVAAEDRERLVATLVAAVRALEPFKQPAPAPAPPPPPEPEPEPEPEGEPYKALYSFGGEQPGDLVFQKGDIIYVQKQDGSWWEGTCNGQYGPFPSNYVARA